MSIVQLDQTDTNKILSSGDYSGYGKDRAFDGDTTTEWASSTPDNGWIGQDAGVAVECVGYDLMPIRATTGPDFDFDRRPFGGVFQGATNAAFTTGLVTYDTYTGSPFRAANDYNYKSVAGGSKRYWRFFVATAFKTIAGGASGGSPAEFRIYVRRVAGVNCRPCRPEITPWGGASIGGRSPRITLTCRTTEASIYYTTDGTTPTNTNGTLYTAPFQISVGTLTVLKAVAYDATCTTALSEVALPANFRNYGYKANMAEYDQDGVLMEIHCPSIIEYPTNSGEFVMVTISGNTNKWTGTDSDGTGKHDALGRDGFWIYKGRWSDDRTHRVWTNCGNIIPMPASWRNVVRPSLIINDAGDLILWGHVYNVNRVADRAYRWRLYAGTDPGTAASWNQVGAYTPDGDGFWDGTTINFKGVPYICYAVQGNTKVNMYQLTSDCLTVTGSPLELTTLPDPSEAVCMFQYSYSGTDRLAILFNSPSNYYDSTLEFGHWVVTTTNPMSLGAYDTPAEDFFSFDPLGTDYNGQFATVEIVSDRVGCVIAHMDYWLDNSGDPYEQYKSRWSPIRVSTATGRPKAVIGNWDFSMFANAPGTGSGGSSSYGATVRGCPRVIIDS